MKIGVLFNCQNVGLAASLRHILPGHDILNYRFADVSQSEDAALTAAEVLRGCDVLITTQTGTKLRAADPDKLAAGGLRVMRIPHIVFGGYHPDTCYSPDPARGIPGPTERFHSRIAACAFLAGLDIEDTLPLYSRLPFARLGYFDAFAQQRAVMIEQWAAHGIDLAPWFARWAEAGCFMHSMNHPKIIALDGLARIVCERLQLTPTETGEYAPDDMVTYASHPVYDDLAAFLGIAAETCFRPASVHGRKPRLMDLADFLARSFAAFSAVPRAVVYALGGLREGMDALNLH